MTIPNRIKRIREREGLTITALAALLSEKRQRIQDIEAGKQKIPQDVLVKYIEYFHIDANWLLTGEGEMYRQATEAANDPVADQRTQKMAGLYLALNEEDQKEILAVAEKKKRYSDLEEQVKRLSEKLG